MTEEKLRQMLREGRGQGEGETYRPWIEVTDFSSRGVSPRVDGVKVRRTHHLLSTAERNAFLLFEWATDVVDIREQFPLDRDTTRLLAAAAGIPHPCYPGTKVPLVLTTDFLLVQLQNGHRERLAVNVKQDEELTDPAVLERLELQRLYFAAIGVRHLLLPASRIPAREAENISLIRTALVAPGETGLSPSRYEELQRVMFNDLARGVRSETLADFCTRFDRQLGLPPATGMRVARMLMWTRAITPDLSAAQLERLPMCSFVISAQPGALRSVSGG